MEIATLGGGCFWCLEAVYDEMDGVTSVESGYMGGHMPNPDYRAVCNGDTGHVEVVQLHFDPAVSSYRDILEVFFAIHDPTSMDRQGNDSGPQYRSAIFYTSEAQKKTAEAVKAKWDHSGKFTRPITTEITAAGKFYPAEDYHQKYLVKNPGGYTCHVLRDL